MHIRTQKGKAHETFECVRSSHQGNVDQSCIGFCLTQVRSTTKKGKLNNHWQNMVRLDYAPLVGKWVAQTGTPYAESSNMHRWTTAYLYCAPNGPTM